MKKLTYYYSLISQPSRAVYLLLKIAEIPFEGKVLDLIKGDQFSEEFVALNPFKRVPIIDHNGFILTESVAILRYLCRTYNVADHWYPKDSVKQARVDEYLEWQHTNTRAHCARYVLHKVFSPMFNEKLVNKVKVARIEELMNQALDQIENVWLKNKQFLCGDEISIADIIGICEIEQLRIAGCDAFARRPNLSKWKARIVSSLGPYYEESNELIKLFAAEYDKKYGALKSHI